MLKKNFLFFIVVTISISLVGCGENSSRETKYIEKVYSIGNAMGTLEGTFYKLALAEDDISLTTDSVPYAEISGTVDALTQTLKPFTDIDKFSSEIQYLSILLSQQANPEEVLSMINIINQKIEKIIPKRVMPYYKLAHSTHLNEKLLQRFIQPDLTLIRLPGDKMRLPAVPNPEDFQFGTNQTNIRKALTAIYQGKDLALDENSLKKTFEDIQTLLTFPQTL